MIGYVLTLEFQDVFHIPETLPYFVTGWHI